jgi:large subunit ribosomal protein L6
MSRVAKAVIDIPADTEVNINGSVINIKGKLGETSINIHPQVKIENNDNSLVFDVNTTDNKEQKQAWMQAGTMRALVANAVKGVSQGWEKKLTLIGVGYRAKVSGKVVDLSLGFSHPVKYQLPEGITADSPSQTEIIIKGMDKQVVGQVAAEIRAFRPPEPYKGKGVRYADEYVARKEAKKK